MKIANFFQLYENLFFQASNTSEKKEINKNLKVTNEKIFIAPNLINLTPIRPKILNLKGDFFLFLFF